MISSGMTSYCFIVLSNLNTKSNDFNEIHLAETFDYFDHLFLFDISKWQSVKRGPGDDMIYSLFAFVQHSGYPRHIRSPFVLCFDDKLTLSYCKWNHLSTLIACPYFPFWLWRWTIRGVGLQPSDLIGIRHNRYNNRRIPVASLICPCREPTRGWLKTIRFVIFNWTRYGTDDFLASAKDEGPHAKHYAWHAIALNPMGDWCGSTKPKGWK